MDNILVRLKPELQKAIKKILKFANNRFHVIAAESGSELKKIGIGELSSVQLGIYSAKKLEIDHPLISNWVSKANLSKNIKYQNGVLFLDVEQDESADVIEIENELTDDEWTENEVEAINDEFSWSEYSDDENETE